MINSDGTGYSPSVVDIVLSWKFRSFLTRDFMLHHLGPGFRVGSKEESKVLEKYSNGLGQGYPL
ncbi:hypothetical protein DIM_12040 [Candidatus Denitrolinea symbiosum]|nr:hypothetical protein DIM_12040 [Candidatus Denitrolinea symbiosum]